ncbi:MAG: SidA/IucD/PvdA family monooxygenase [Acidimicrobiales bacterium]
MSPDTPTDVEVDVLGVGFGPSNLALAIALSERPGPPLRSLYCEAQPEPGWHAGMLLDGASMQVSFLKDLVTFRNPNSPYSFVSFLHTKGRLADFTNRGVMEPLRVEFAAYLRWVAAAFADQVQYATRVTRISPVYGGARAIDAFDVAITSPPGDRIVRARSVVVAAGLQPRLPEVFSAGDRCWHSSSHLHRVAALCGPSHLVVAGTGQSAVEIALDLNERHPDAVVHLVSSQFGPAPSFQGPLVNAIFDPETVDLLYGADDEVRDRMDRLHRNTNNGTASTEVIQELFDRIYRDRWLDRERIVLHRASRIGSMTHGSRSTEVVIQSDATRSEQTIAADAIVFATGYDPLDVSVLLGPHASAVRRDTAGRPVIGRDHRAALIAPGRAALVLIGQSQHLHGISTTLLSTVAVRAGEVAQLVATTAAPQPQPHNPAPPTPSSGASMPNLGPITIDQARSLVADLVPDDITQASADEDLRDYGLDSVRLLSVVERVSDAGGHLVYSDVLGGTTLQTVAGALARTQISEGAT